MPAFRGVRADLVPLALVALLTGCGDPAAPPPTAEPMSVEDFRRELINLPMCGTPKSGPLAGKSMCTVHLADGTATLAGPGIVARFVWEPQGRAICRRDVLASRALMQEHLDETSVIITRLTAAPKPSKSPKRRARPAPMTAVSGD